MRASDKQQLGFLIRDVLPALLAVSQGYSYDPGDSDLDDEQPIWVRITLGDYRRVSKLALELANDFGEQEEKKRKKKR